MAQSLFTVVTVPGTLERSQRARCTTARCETFTDFPLRGGQRTAPDGAVLRRLMTCGWRIKRNGQVRECPTCAGRPVELRNGADPHCIVEPCVVEGCKEQHTLTPTGRTKDGHVPRAALWSQLKAAGWGKGSDAAYGHGFLCPTHATNIAAARIALRVRLEGREAVAARYIADGDTPTEAYAVIDDAELIAGASVADGAAGLDAAADEARSLQERRQQEKEARMATTAAAARHKPAEPPPEASREQKRAINAKLSEVYADAGYAADWSDAKVAETLNVPRAWVRDIRADFFGDQETNEADARAARDRQRLIHELRRDLDATVKKTATALATLGELDATTASLNARLRALEGK